MRAGAMIVLAAALAAASPAAAAEDVGYTFEFSGGAAWNAPARLKITQSGQPDIVLTGRYETHAFRSPLYWAARAGRRRGSDAWELELVHDKIYLENPPADVQGFSISHGFNILTVSRAWDRYGLLWRIGAGVVITHPESTVRGRSLDESGGIAGGYHVSGPAVQLGAQKRISVRSGLFGTLESKLTASWVRVPVADGHAEFTNVALHGLFGVGYDSSGR